jgi:signal peptidase
VRGVIPTVGRTGRAPLIGRVGSAVLWYVVPALALAAVVAYVLGATIGHANPPIVPVSGTSMRPTLQGGDLVVLRGVDPRALRKGDIVAVNVPKDARSQYSLPGQIVHRIVRVGHDSGGIFFITKGDANAGADVFQTRPGDVVGKLSLVLPGAGYPVLFFRSRQGEILLGVAVLVAVLYFVLGLFDERRAYLEESTVTIQKVLEETHELKRVVANAVAPPVDYLARDVRTSTETVRELVGAVSEYGEHLRSHTAVMKSLAETTAELQRATTQMRVAVENGRSTETFVPSRALIAGSPLRSELDRAIEETRAEIARASAQREELRRQLHGGTDERGR